MKRFLLALAACVAISSTAFASNDPVTFNDETHYFTYPVFTLEENKALEAEANFIVKNTIAQQEAYLANNTDNCASVSLGYELFRDDEKYLSFILKPGSYASGAAHGIYRAVAYTFDKVTGERLSATHFYPWLNKEDLFASITSGAYPTYGINRKLIKPENLLLHDIEFFNPKFDNLIIDRNNHAYLIFSPYDLAAYVAGITFVGLPALKD